MRYRLSIIILLVLGIAACSDPVTESREMVDAARAYTAKNQIRAAALELKNAIKLRPDFAEARYLLGQLNMVVGDYAAAEKEFRKAREAGWDEAGTAVGIAASLLANRDYTRVVEQTRIEQGYPPAVRADLLALRGMAALALADRRTAAQMLRQALETDPGSYHAARLQASEMMDKGRYADTQPALAQALEAYPDDAGLLVISAVAYIRDDDLAGASRAYRRILEREPANLVTALGRSARLGLSQILIRNRELEAAQAVIEPLFGRYGKDPMTNYIGGMLALQQDELGTAEERLLRVLKVAPEHNNTQLLYGAVSYAQKNYEQAAYYLSKYVDKVPGNTEASKLLGRTYMILGQDDNASELLESLTDSDDSELLALIGYSQLRSGNLAAGIAGLQQAMDAAPGDTGIRSELAKAYLTAGETERAITELNKLMSQEGGSNRTDSLMIIAHLRSGQNEKAIDVALTALSRNPESPAVLTLAGNVFIATDDRPEGRKYLARALQRNPGFVPAAMSLASLYEDEGEFGKAYDLYDSVSDLGERSVEPLLAMARIAEADGDDERKVRILERARVQAPEETTPMLMLAQHYLVEGDIEDADRIIGEIEKLLPNSSAALSMRARQLMAARQHNEALAPLNELVTRMPKSDFARSMLAETYWRLGQHADAKRQLEIVLKRQAYYLPALKLMANVKQSLGATGEALQLAASIQRVAPEQYSGYEIAADLYLSQRKYEQSIADYLRALEREPLAVLALKLSEAYRQSGRLDEAAGLLQDWVTREPDNARLRQALGYVYLESGERDAAIAEFERALEQKPDDILALNNLAWLYSSSNLDKAVDYAARAYKLSPQDAGIMDTYGWILLQQGDVAEGRRILQQAYQQLGSVPEVAYHYAVALMRSGESLEGKRLLKQTLRKHADFPGRQDAEQLAQ